MPRRIQGTWYRASFKSGKRTFISCCSDCGTVSLSWNGGYQDLHDWTERGLKDLLESVFGEPVTSLAVS